MKHLILTSILFMNVHTISSMNTDIQTCVMLDLIKQAPDIPSVANVICTFRLVNKNFCTIVHKTIGTSDSNDEIDFLRTGSFIRKYLLPRFCGFTHDIFAKKLPLKRYYTVHRMFSFAIMHDSIQKVQQTLTQYNIDFQYTWTMCKKDVQHYIKNSKNYWMSGSVEQYNQSFGFIDTSLLCNYCRAMSPKYRFAFCKSQDGMSLGWKMLLPMCANTINDATPSIKENNYLNKLKKSLCIAQDLCINEQNRNGDTPLHILVKRIWNSSVIALDFMVMPDYFGPYFKDRAISSCLKKQNNEGYTALLLFLKFYSRHAVKCSYDRCANRRGLMNNSKNIEWVLNKFLECGADVTQTTFKSGHNVFYYINKTQILLLTYENQMPRFTVLNNGTNKNFWENVLKEIK